MNDFTVNTNPSGPKRVRLTREELLAGKCFPEEDNFSLDPRLRSPDDFFAQRSRTPSAVQTSIAGFQQRYETEMQAWREYEAKVLEWKKEVIAILEQYKSAADEKESVVQELQKAQQKLQEQEQELAWFRQQLMTPTQTTF